MPTNRLKARLRCTNHVGSLYAGEAGLWESLRGRIDDELRRRLIERRVDYLLHNQRAALLKALLLLRGDQRVVVINVPWYLTA